MVIRSIAIVAALAVASAEYTFTITNKCTNNSVGYCTEWTQSGTIKEESSCFPANAVVFGENGRTIRMDKLQIGDSILGYNPETDANEFTKVRAWLHRDPQTDTVYNVIDTGGDTLVASPKHNIATISATVMNYDYSENLHVGHNLKGVANTLQIVSSKQDMFHGAYAPYTYLSNFYVGTKNATYLAHSFAHIQNPTHFETTFAGIMWVAEMFDANVHRIPNMNGTYVHPVAQLTARTFPWIVDFPTDLTHSSLRGKSSPRALTYVPSPNSATTNNNNAEREEEMLMRIMAASISAWST